MKKGLLLAGRFFFDFFAFLVILSLAAAFFQSRNPGTLAFSLANWPSLLARTFPYCTAFALAFSFPRINARIKSRLGGYCLLLVLMNLLFLVFAYCIPFIPVGKIQEAPIRMQFLENTLIPVEQGEIWIQKLKSREAQGILLVKKGGSPSLEWYEKAPYDPQKQTVILQGKNVGPIQELPSPETTIFKALDFDGMALWLAGLARMPFTERAPMLVALGIALAFLWPLSRIGAWPMVAFTISFSGLAGYFAYFAFIRSAVFQKLTAYINLSLSPLSAILFGCGATVLVCLAFDFLFLGDVEKGL